MQYDYSTYHSDMILRDHLAYDRTKFALLRTFLAIARTALGLYATGLGLIIAKASPVLVSLGYIVVVFATAVLVVGVVYSLRAKHRLDGLKDSSSLRGAAQ